MFDKQKKLAIIKFVAWVLLALTLGFHSLSEIKKSKMYDNWKSPKEHSFYCQSGTTKEWKKHKSHGLPEINGNTLVFINSNGRQTITMHNIPCIMRITDGEVE